MKLAVKSSMQKRKKLQHGISTNSLEHCIQKFLVFRKLSEAVKKVAKLALVISTASYLSHY